MILITAGRETSRNDSINRKQRVGRQEMPFASSAVDLVAEFFRNYDFAQSINARN